MFNSQTTTEQIVKPLLSIVQKLQSHISNQQKAVQLCEVEIEGITKAREAYIADSERAAKTLENIQKIIG